MYPFTSQLKDFRRFLFIGLVAFVLVMALVFPGHTITLSRDIPVYLTAEQIKHDQNRDLIIASGKVEIMQGERVLLADTLTYNQSTNIVSAKGHVTLLEPSGEVLFADYVKLTNEMRDGIIEQLRLRMTDDSRMAANGARKKGPITHYEQGRFFTL